MDSHKLEPVALIVLGQMVVFMFDDAKRRILGMARSATRTYVKGDGPAKTDGYAKDVPTSRTRSSLYAKVNLDKPPEILSGVGNCGNLVRYHSEDRTLYLGHADFLVSS